MDYSLLVGIHDPSLPPEEEGSNTGSITGNEMVTDVGDKDGGKSEDDNSDNEEVPGSPVSPTARGTCLHLSLHSGCLTLGVHCFRRPRQFSGGS